MQGTNWSMEKQVALFNLTVHHNLPKHFKTKAGLSDYLSKSLFLIATGTADYKYNYLQPQFYNSSKKYNPDQFSRLLVNRLGEQLQVFSCFVFRLLYVTSYQNQIEYKFIDLATLFHVFLVLYNISEVV